MAKNKQVIFVKTKTDIIPKNDDTDSIEISSKSGFGIEDLKNKILTAIKNLIHIDTDYTTNKRQQTCLLRAKESLENVINTSTESDLADLYAIDLKAAILARDEITGEVLTDDILDNIFSNFCIGK